MARKREERAAKNESGDKDSKSEAAEIHDDDQGLTASFNNQLSAMGLMQREVPGDGNCLFRALGDQIEGHARKHLQHRQDTVEYMRQHRKDFEPFIEDDVSFDGYVNNLEKPGTYAGNDAIVAFSRKHSVTVVIHQLNSPLWKVHGGEPNKTIHELHIAYHNGDHYNSIRRIGDYSENPANVKLAPEIHSIPDVDAEHRYDGYYGVRPYDDDSSEDDDENDLVQLVMKQSGCQDRSLAKRILEERSSDVESAVHLLLRGKEGKDAGGIAYLSETGDALWGPEGTGSRLFGSDATLIAEASLGGAKQKFPKPGSESTDASRKRLSGKRLEEAKKRERKMRSELRKKRTGTAKEYLNLGENLHTVLVQKLGCVNI